VYTRSNPHRSSASTTDGTTTYTYDGLGRTIVVSQPDGSAVNTAYDVPAILPGDCTMATDETGKLRLSCVDALGRLTGVEEPGPVVPGTAGSGSITVSGSEQSATGNATAGSGTVTIGGSEQVTTYYPCGVSSCPTTLYDTGSVTIRVNGFAASITYNQYSTVSSVAAALVSALSSASSPVTATVSGTVITMTAKTTGASTNYSLSSTSSTSESAYFSYPSFFGTPSGSTLTGGKNGGTIYDTGTVSVTVNGFTASISYSQTVNNTPTLIASSLASGFNSGSGSPVTATSSGATLTLTANTVGSTTDYSVASTSSTTQGGYFTHPSFTVTSTTLSGGSDAPPLGNPLKTLYTYDVLNNLTCGVQQGTDTTAFTTCAAASANWRPRSFIYDSLSRLTSATNPESGTITYAYDLNSNLSSKISPKPNPSSTGTITTNYSYDVLDRLTQKSYVNLATPTAQFAYDGSTLTGCTVAPPTIQSPTNLVGRRSAMCAGLSASKWSYDPVGRTIVDARTNKGSSSKTQTVSYLYNLDGSLQFIAYPIGKLLHYTVGGAGRVTQVDDTLDTFAASIAYTPNGFVASGVQGPVVINNAYDDRLQPILLSDGIPGQNPIFSLCYDFHLHIAINNSPCNFSAYTTGNNGNVFQVLNNVDSTRSAVYAYDSLNRVAQANTVNTTSTNCWGETYSIDSWGNLYGRAGAPGMAGSCTMESLSATVTAKNQLSGNGMLYDAAGNVTTDNLGNMSTYDSENRIATVAGFTYSYDADGTRMEKASGSSGTMYWPGPWGTLTETALTGTINEEYVYLNGERIARVDRPSGTVHYYFSDKLGSASVIASSSGTPQAQYFYYPYGGMQSSTGSDFNHYKFTGKERDTESGLDMFGARYYGSSLGRFMTPDWAAKPIDVPYANFGNPQSLNLYSYVQNNPTTLGDPDGHCAEDACIVEGTAAIGAAVYVGGAALLAGTAAVLSTPSGQRSLSTFTSAASQSISDSVHSISSFFHPNNSGQNAPSPPTVPTNVPQGTPASTSQQGAVNTSPVESRSFSPGVKAGADANAGGKCEYCGAQTVPGQKSQPGLTPPANERQTDHYVPSSQGGANTADNAVNACRTCNGTKSDTQPQGTKWELPRMKKPDGQ
jgi:RHS repeat-associated protein